MIAAGAAAVRWPPEQQLLCYGVRSCSSCAMSARAGVIVRWPPEQQICEDIIEVVEEVMEPQRRQRKQLDGRRRGTTGDQAETAVYERPSCKQSVFSKMLAIETIALCAHYLQYIKELLLLVMKCTSML